MRGTKHDASQHQRRGIRSRLIASVAAVAMLATSIAAGTAVAADIDEADPTQQNTIVEQPQQGTENAGDQTGEQNTESEGDQTDQPQESDGTEAEAESDNAAEADVTEETTPKTDADKTDTNQSSEKQSDAVPAPQAANEAEPRRNTLPVDENRSTDNGITVNLFDYDGQDAENDLNWGINNHHALKFSGGGDNAAQYGDWNQWTGREDSDRGDGGVYQGIVEDQLDDEGYPVLSGDKVGKSLKYLFDDTEDTNHAGVSAKHLDVDGLFSYDSETGYYDYNSADNFATYDEDTGNFKVYDRGRFTNYKTVGLPYEAGAFLPFNDLTNQTSKYTAPRGNATGYTLEGGDTDYHFGMSVEAQFYMPKDRTVNGDPMKFEFSGDDDVWVFVDGKLVLDLGGIHDDYSGSIDFSTGTVTVERKFNPDDKQHSSTNVETYLADVLGDDWAEPYQQHTLKVFYLERGKGGSNCLFHFNLPTIPRGNVSFAKAVAGDADATKEYRFNAYVDKDGNDQNYQLYTGRYQVYSMDGNSPVGDPQTAADGVISLKNGQYATLIDEGISITSWYYVTELYASDYTVTASNGVSVTMNDDGSAQTDHVAVQDVAMLTVTNTVLKPDNRKWIDRNGTNDYTLNLSVTGKETTSEQTSTSTKKVDVVFVLDMSGSMNKPEDNSRLSKLKTATKSLSQILYSTDGIDAQTSVITFSSSAELVEQGMTTKNQLDNCVDKLVAGGSTYWQTGLNKVNDVTTRSDAEKYVVFLTDGDPGQSGWESGNYYNFSARETYNASVATGKSLVRAGWNILNVGVDMPETVWVDPNADEVSTDRRGRPVNHSFSRKNGWVSPLEALTSREQSVNGQGKTVKFTETSSDELQKVFEDLAETITTRTTYRLGNVTIKDVVSEWADPQFTVGDDNAVTGGVTVKKRNVVVYQNGANVPDTGDIVKEVTYDSSTRTLTVTFKDKYVLDPDVDYTVSFGVKPSEKAFEQYSQNLSDSTKNPYSQSGDVVDKGEPGTGETSAGKDGFFTNDEASVGYTLCSIDEDQTVDCNGSPGQLPYNHPVLQVEITPLSYGTKDHLGLRKELVGDELEGGSFWFDLTSGTFDDSTNTFTESRVDGMTFPGTSEVPNGDTDGDGEANNGGDAGAFTFGEIAFSQPGTYYVKVTENQDRRPDKIGQYSFDEHELYVKYVIGINTTDGSLQIEDRSVRRSDGDQWIDAWGDDSEVTTADLTWTNTYVAPVSSLPLTGGNSTARTLLLAGGGVLLVAGAAWLLARRRQA